jgi:hypothetical protein
MGYVQCFKKSRGSERHVTIFNLMTPFPLDSLLRLLSGRHVYYELKVLHKFVWYKSPAEEEDIE